MGEGGEMGETKEERSEVVERMPLPRMEIVHPSMGDVERRDLDAKRVRRLLLSCPARILSPRRRLLRTSASLPGSLSRGASSPCSVITPRKVRSLLPSPHLLLTSHLRRPRPPLPPQVLPLPQPRQPRRHSPLPHHRFRQLLRRRLGHRRFPQGQDAPSQDSQFRVRRRD